MKRTINLLIFDAENRLYLQFRDGTPGICNPLEWNFFGGAIEPGESILSGALRELHEEIGVQARPEDLEVLFEGEILGKEITTALRLKRAIPWNEITLQEGAGCGRFTQSEMTRLSVTPVTRTILDQIP